MTQFPFKQDYMSGGELFYHLKRQRVFSEEATKFFAAELTSALIHLHSLQYVNIDLYIHTYLLFKF